MNQERGGLIGMLWFALLCAAAAFAPWLGGQLTGAEPWAARAIAGAAGVLWLLDRRGVWMVPRPVVWLWLFIGWSTLTILWSANRHDSIAAVFDLISWAVLATLSADAAHDARRRRILLGSLMGGFAVVSALGAWDSLTNIAGWRIFGPFATPNLFAAYLITVLPLAVFVAASRPLRGAGARPLLLGGGAVAAALGGAALAATGSKGAILAFVLAMTIALSVGFARHLRSGAWLLAVALAVALSIGGGVLLGRVGAAGSAEAHSAQFRVWTWKAAALMARDNAVGGVGAGAFGSAFNRYALAGWTEAAHNAYLQTAAETGLPGLALFLAALGSAVAGLIRAARAPGPATALIGAAALAGLLAAAAHNVVDYGWTLWAPAAVLWILIGAAIAGLESSIRPLPRAAAAAMFAPLGLMAIGGALAANAAALAAPPPDQGAPADPGARMRALESARRLDPLDARIARELGVARALAGDGAGSIEALRAAARLAPGEPTTWRFLGEAYQNAGRLDDARAAFDEGLRQAPHALKILLDAARLADATNRHHEAQALYLRILETWNGPTGRFRATPELVPVEPIAAHAALAAEAESEGRGADAKEHSREVLALANLYEENRDKYPMIWQATGQDDPATLAAVRAMRSEAERRLGARGIVK